MRVSIIPKADIQWIITALANDAGDFGLRGASLRHRPTGHSFEFTVDGRLQRARYFGWIRVPVSDEQGVRLSRAFADWKRFHRRDDPPRRRIESGSTDLRDSAMVLAILAASFLFLMAEARLLDYLR